jgi:hypothetical protein
MAKAQATPSAERPLKMNMANLLVRCGHSAAGAAADTADKLEIIVHRW